MAYKYSKIDSDNIGWFKKDDSRATLLGMQLVEGRFRGLNPFSVTFQYPISVFAGKNCSGKSTLLAIASCAFHNSNNGFKPAGRIHPYYTFSDFFIQSKDEIPPGGIHIRYKILHNDWKVTKYFPKGTGTAVQTRRKKVGGKWNDYSKRVYRNVVFLGIERVVPFSEKKVYKSYHRYFKNSQRLGWEPKVKLAVGKILGKSYDDLWFVTHGKYRIPMVKVENHTYSGFNMGAGENALIEFFSLIYGCPKGILIVIDEMELGLHEEAQIRFINELKTICYDQKAQVIGTTHSQTILKHLPPVARYYLETIGDNTIITDSITSKFAAGKLAGENSNELDIFVEDSIAKKILELAISTDVRNRINIIPIGSASAISRQMAARYKNLKRGECIAIMDGDQKELYNDHKAVFINALECKGLTDEIENWLMQRIEYIPGDTWPESWILNEIKNSDCSLICSIINVNRNELITIIQEALIAGKHNEFFTLSNKTNLDKDLLVSICAKEVICKNIERFKILEMFIKHRLDQQ